MAWQDRVPYLSCVWGSHRRSHDHSRMVRGERRSICKWCRTPMIRDRGTWRVAD